MARGELVRLYRQMAATGNNFQGLAILQHKDEIGDLIRASRSRTILDYGAGRGNAYEPPHEIHRAWGVPKPTLYDPAFESHDVLPPEITFDLVICNDVLEHVPENEVVPLISELFECSNGQVWASVCCRPAKKRFADGRNMHVTVRPLEWWREIFKATSGRHGGCINWTLRESP